MNDSVLVEQAYFETCKCFGGLSEFRAEINCPAQMHAV